MNVHAFVLVTVFHAYIHVRFLNVCLRWTILTNRTSQTLQLYSQVHLPQVLNLPYIHVLHLIMNILKLVLTVYLLFALHTGTYTPKIKFGEIK